MLGVWMSLFPNWEKN